MQAGDGLTIRVALAREDAELCGHACATLKGVPRPASAAGLVARASAVPVRKTSADGSSTDASIPRRNSLRPFLDH